MSSRSLVIVPVDDSPDTEAAVQYAVNTARHDAADVHAVQVVRRGGRLWLAPEGEVRLRARLRVLQAAAEQDAVRMRIVTLRGAPERVIPAYAQLNEARLIVVRRHYGSPRFWHNSVVVGRLSRSSPVPVVVLPAPGGAAAGMSLNRIVAAVDFTVASAIALRTAVDLAKRHGARLTIVHAMDPLLRMVFSGGEAWRAMQRLPSHAQVVAQRLRDKAMALGSGSAEPVVVTGNPHRGIVETAAEGDADLIVMGVAPRHWIDQTVFGSTLRSVLRRAMTPVLVLPVIAGANEWIDAIKREEDVEARATGWGMLA